MNALFFEFVFMGAAASVQDLVQALGDEVSKDECRTLSKNLFWTGDVEDWIEDIFDGETISKAKINRKIAKEQEKLHRAQQKEEARVKEINRQKGQRIYADALASEKVAGLSALPANFRDGVVPRDTAEASPATVFVPAFVRSVILVVMSCCDPVVPLVVVGDSVVSTLFRAAERGDFTAST